MWFRHLQLPLGIAVLVCPGAARAAPAGNANAALIIAAKSVGEVWLESAGQREPLRVDQRVPEGATITTGADASAVLVLSNGATLQLQADTSVRIGDYFQGPFANSFKVETLAQEPSPSRTNVVLVRGEVVSNVKALRTAEGSFFRLQTPVGVIEPRGDVVTTFVTAFRPAPAGRAVKFRTSTVGGDVFISSNPPHEPIVLKSGNTVNLDLEVHPDGAVTVTPTQPQR